MLQQLIPMSADVSVSIVISAGVLQEGLLIDLLMDADVPKAMSSGSVLFGSIKSWLEVPKIKRVAYIIIKLGML